MKSQTTLSGVAVSQLLREGGVSVQKVVRKQGTSLYTAEFFYPEMQQATYPAWVWAEQIQRCLGGNVQIVHTNDTIATWRPDNPVICALVTFAFLTDKAA